MKTTLSFLILALLSGGCATTNSNTAAARPKTLPIALGPYSTPQKNVMITSRDRGAYVALKQNGVLTVALNCNASAGYYWKLAEPLNQAVLTKVSPTGNQLPRVQLPPIALPPEAATRPTPEQWVFKAVGAGKQKVRMIYSRFDRPLGETATFDFTVVAE